MAQAVVKSSCRKLRSAIGDEDTKRLKFTGDMQEMLEQLEAIHAVIPNAEKYWWMVKDQDRGEYPLTELDWLTNVKGTADMICHMVDEMQDMSTPAARNKMENVVETKSKEMLDNINKIKEKLKELQESVEFDAHNMKALLQAQEGAIGREKDIDGILDQLSVCPTSKGPVILLINGFVGVGKATVAAMIFEHDRFKRYSRVWINHSNMLGLCEIGKYIISQVSAGEEETTGHGSSSNDNIRRIKTQLHSVLNGKKVLLVLHDLWKEEKQWKNLKDMLSVKGTGIGITQVIVIATISTCRKDTSNNAQVMETFGVPQYYLNPLSDEMCCNIIMEAAICSQGRSASKEDLGKIAPEIAKLCKGVPLAAQLFGSVLKFKQYAKWPELLDSQAFSTSSSVDSTSSPVDPVNISLELSYKSMPPNLRSCFAYCAIFNMERIIVKEDLIHQWMALDLIEPSEEFSTTQLAEQYLKRLLDMSLLQTTPWTSAISVTMHGSVRLFAKTVAEDCGFLDKVGRKSDNIESCSYALVSDFKPEHLKTIFSEQNKLRALRCLGCSKIELCNDDSLSFAKHLRVLELHDESSMLPESICQLRHLQYLKLSGWSELVTLPESIGDLTNLLHMDLSGCSCLVNLPESFGKLTKLEHINLSGCPELLNLPESFEKLINLKHINLSGCTELLNLPESFEKLAKLEHINLSDCLALVNLPGSFGELINLEHINLSGCLALVNLPESFGKLKNLEHINLSGCFALVNLPGSFGELAKLEHINLSGCLALVNLPGSFGKLTNLEHINLSGCLALVNLPDSFGKLTKLVPINLSGCLALGKLPDSLGNLTKLVHINLSGWRALVKLPGSFGNLTKLMHINLSGCLALVKLPGSFGNLTKLVHINLSGCLALVKLPGSFVKLTNLKHVNLSGCSGLKELPQSFGKIISLVHINLSGCSGLVTLPGSLGDLRNLLHIDLSRCYGLQKLPESFRKLKKLVHLDLSFCSCFEEIQIALCGLTNLRHLNLSHPCCYRADYPCLNGLKELLCQFTGLEHLNLSMFLNLIFCNHSEEENREYMEFIRVFSKLEHLDLSHSIFLRHLPESLTGLNRLQTVDLSGCIRLKKVPEWMAETSSLKSVVLSNVESYRFVVGTDNVINNYGQLVDVIYKELEITCLEKMKKSVVEVWRTRLVEKQYLQKLKLCWTLRSDPLVHHDVLLGKLVPPHSLQYLELHGYGGWVLPIWLTSSSMASYNLVELTMADIPNCQDLPLLGLLPNLQRVVLRRMANIKIIDADELTGGNTTAFNRLCNFTIEDMGKLEKLKYYSNGFGEDELPLIVELVVHKCPKLSSVSLPPRARRLVISDCNDVSVCWQNRAGTHVSKLPQVTELVVKNCNVYPSDCSLPIHLTALCVSHCDQMDMLPKLLGGLTSLRELQIKACAQLQNLLDSVEHLTSLEELVIEGCANIKSLPRRIGELTNLKDLRIRDCKFLKQWCGKKVNKKILGHIRPKFENVPVSNPEDGGVATEGANQARCGRSSHCDEDISITATPTATLVQVTEIQGPITRARALKNKITEDEEKA